MRTIFLAAAIIAIFVTCINVPVRLLQIVYPFYNPFGYSTTSCKILRLFVFSARAYTSWCIVLVSIDRFMCSLPSVVIRGWSNLRVGTHAVLVVLVVAVLFYLYVRIQFENILGLGKCPENQSIYSLFIDICNLLVLSLGPSIIILISGSLTIRHVQKLLKRIVSRNIQVQTQAELTYAMQDQRRRQKAADRQLSQMMLTQSVYLTLMLIPISPGISIPQ